VALFVIGEPVAQRLPQVTPESVGFSSNRLARLDGVIEEAIANKETPGAVVAVIRNGKIVYRKAYGNRAIVPEKEPMTLDTIFDMASLTKVMATATSIMLLVEEGKLSLTDRVVDYIPEFKAHDKESITLKQLLTHFSGLRPDLDLDDPWSGYDTAIRLACGEKLVAEPGERFIYSDINYFLLSEVVRRVTGQYIDEFSTERIFKPLGMHDTSFRPPVHLAPRIAPCDRRNGRIMRGEVNDPTTFRMGGVAGHAGLFSTIDDTAIWAQMILQGGEFDGVRILSPLSVLKMTTPQSPPGQFDWRGFGFDIETRFSTNRGDLYPVGSFGHTGFTGTSFWLDPFTDSIVLLFTNRLHPDGKGSVVSLRKKVASVVAGALIDVSLERSHYYRRKAEGDW